MTATHRSILAAAVLTATAAAFLFPPADRRFPSVMAGDYKLSEAAVKDNGFTFISNVGGLVVIRHAQWIVELLVLGAASAWLLRRRAVTESPTMPPLIHQR